jgi:hypothetical protein
MRAIRWFVRFEVGIWRSLFLWVTRRVAGQGPGVATFSYARQLIPLLCAFIFVSVIELPVVHLLIPWDTVRLVALVISVWGLLWMFGLLASMKVFPHLLDESGLRIRYGTSVDIHIPWTAVAHVTARRRGEGDEDGAVATVPVLKQTRVDIALHRPTEVALPDGTREITELRLYADDARAFVAAAREQLAQRHAARPVSR